MTWEKCPICNGEGKIPNTCTSSLFSECPTCRGKRIINSLNGFPPCDNAVNDNSEQLSDSLQAQNKRGELDPYSPHAKWIKP